MNLFHKPSLSELARLIDQISQHNKSYNIIVDHDGEVLVDTNMKWNTSVLSKFKFHFAGMTKNVNLKQDAEKYLNFLNKLYTSLVFCWEENLEGKVDYRLISKIQERMFSKKLVRSESDVYFEGFRQAI